MKFISFQPSENVKIDRQYDFTDPYKKYIGFNPMYCTYAGTLKSAVIGTMLAEISLPEEVLFIKADDFWLIGRTEHQNSLNSNFSIKNEPIPKEYAMENVDNLNDFLNVMYLDFEFLVNPGNVKIIERINIKEHVTKLFEEANVDYQNMLKSNTDIIYQELKCGWKDYCKKNNDRNKHKPSDIFLKRKAEAEAFFEPYFMDNDIFLNDFKKIFKFKEFEDDIKLNKFRNKFRDKFNKYKKDFENNPCRETLEKYKSYMENILVDKKIIL